MTNEITSVASLLESIREIRQQHPGAELFYRGESRVHKSIEPSIYRRGFIENEDILFKEYILRNPDDFKGERSTFEKLVKMQHYKLPTRLLDITANPLMGLYFATETDPGEAGRLIVFAVKKGSVKYYDSDTVSVVSNVSRRPFNALTIPNIERKAGESESAFRERFNKETPIQYLLHEIKDEKPYFKDIIEKRHLESVLCVKPLLNNRRVIKQDGAFLLFGITGDKSKPAAFGNDIVPDIRIVKKSDVLRSELRLLGVTKDKVYPELDTTADYLREKYAKA